MADAQRDTISGTVARPDVAEMFRPPVNRAMRTLDRSFFKKAVPLSAARIHKNQDISQCRQHLLKSKDMLDLERLTAIHPDPDQELARQGRKCLLLKPEIRHDDASTLTPKILELLTESRISLIPYSLHLTYDYWSYHEIMTSILPEDVDELPVGFQTVGHVAHLNLREHYAPHKHLIAEVLRDKNPKITTVINKIDDVGAENVYRTFSYEVLAGKDDLNVEVKEQDCIFRFDYSKVYWNSRLNTEHERMVNNFAEGEAICDITAGIGPFAVPAGKRRVFVWANDLNPESYAHLQQSIATNKVGNFVQPFNQDGRTFIRRATQELLEDERTVSIPQNPSRRRKPAKQDDASEPATNGTAEPPKAPMTYTQPRTFQHYVSNLPASGIEFLSSFRDLYTAEQRSLFSPHTAAKLPMVHTYTFGPKDLDTAPAVVCAKSSEHLGYELKLGDQHETSVYDVRDVAPNKRMFCISFRLPEQVAFGEEQGV